jgi:putative glutamine amidotransferase
MKITIGITDCRKYKNYENWILSQHYEEKEVSVIKLNQHNFQEIEKCDGIILSGGEDIHPKFYCKTADDISQNLALCNHDFMDENRDEFELKVCDYIFKNKVNVLGICRGLQLVNVFLGGTLIPDIPNLGGKKKHSMLNEFDDENHFVKVLENSQLAKIIGKNVGNINSAHHQSADKIANSLTINALSEDGIVEGLEWSFDFAQPDSRGFAQPDSRDFAQPPPFLMLVQWHPERMLDLESEFSKNILAAFVEAVSKKVALYFN